MKKNTSKAANDEWIARFSIEPWMTEELDLRGNDLMAFARIHAETSGGWWTRGMRKDIMAWLGVSAPTFGKIIDRLVAKGCIDKIGWTGSNGPGTIRSEVHYRTKFPGRGRAGETPEEYARETSSLSENPQVGLEVKKLYGNKYNLLVPMPHMGVENNTTRSYGMDLEGVVVGDGETCAIGPIGVNNAHNGQCAHKGHNDAMERNVHANGTLTAIELARRSRGLRCRELAREAAGEGTARATMDDARRLVARLAPLCRPGQNIEEQAAFCLAPLDELMARGMDVEEAARCAERVGRDVYPGAPYFPKWVSYLLKDNLEAIAAEHSRPEPEYSGVSWSKW